MRILIAEDDLALAQGLARVLEGEGFAVAVCGRGDEALRLARSEHFDLLILDLGLPAVDGLEILRSLRDSGRRLQVLVLTGRDATDARVRALDSGADDYLTKPFATAELVARVRALARRRPAPNGSKLVHGPLTVDTAARRAYLGGEPLELTGREWAVLGVLLAKADKVVSKESVALAITGGLEAPSAKAIEVYVSRLRGKLEPAGIRIRTVRGFGYMLEEFGRRR
jgi:DNA-binding response OmpR family regulator